MFEISEASGVQTGTKIIIYLKEDCKEFASEERVKGEQVKKGLSEMGVLGESSMLAFSQ